MRTWLVILICLLSLAVLSADAQELKVLVLAGNVSNAEFPQLEKFDQIEGFKYSYEKTSDRALPGLKSVDILWIGQGEICENAYFFKAETENAIKSFVESGGIVISLGQDSDGGRPCEVGWVTAPMVGVERGGVEIFDVTKAPEVGDLFKRPNDVRQIHHDDAWTEPDPSIILLSTINGGADVGIGLLQHGKGYYLITSIENEDAGDVAVNAPIMENLLLYAAQLKTFSVESSGKLAVRWADLKSQ